VKLLIAGNLANTGYFLASKLREVGVNADLLMEKNPEFMSDPLNTGELSGKYPDWIKFWDKNQHWKTTIVFTMRKYDLISAATELPIFALLSLKPYIALATGSDLRELAHHNNLKGRLLRKAYRNAKVVIFTDPDLIKSTEILKLKNAVYLPPLRDFKKFKKPDKKIALPQEKFIFFHPTNHIWKLKKNEIFLKAFVRLTKERDDVFLITIKKGSDADKSIKLLRDSVKEENYRILPEVLNQSDMSFYYQNCDVVVDQFGLGSIGSIGLEGMYFAKPVVAFINENVYSKLYDEIPPILSSNTENEVYEFIKKLIESTEFCVTIGQKSSDWITKFHSKEKTLKKYLLLCNLVSQGRHFNDLKKALYKNN